MVVTAQSRFALPKSGFNCSSLTRAIFDKNNLTLLCIEQTNARVVDAVKQSDFLMLYSFEAQ